MKNVNVKTFKIIFLSHTLSQDERFLHLSAEEMSNVEKCVNECMGWMNAKMNAQSKLAITQDPVVKVADIIAKLQVCDDRLKYNPFFLL